ncbi:hypothetical protein ACIRU3_08190 [Streptomyces sp. NPDC101151]|uniref:hypothetical protein n=1 Tax=Streptomyces sp. NPDC101151 TaxID=3366115 RepID=UPI003827BE8F
MSEESKGAPCTGPEHVAEAGRRAQQFALRHARHPKLPAITAAFEAVPTASDGAQITAVLRSLVPVYCA